MTAENMSQSREHLNTPALRELVISAAHIAAPIFVAQGWTWGGYGTPKRIPTEGQIALRLRELCQTAFTEAAAGTTSSGRFTVQADDEGVSISLDLGCIDVERPTGSEYVAGCLRADGDPEDMCAVCDGGPCVAL